MKILAYHSIGDSVKEVGAGLYCVSEDVFREQLEYLRNKDVIITFDDGDITNYTKAYPVLKEFGLTAYFFIIGEWVGAPGYMGWREIKELQRGGMTIGSHGMTHRILTELNDVELYHELRESKSVLEKNLSCTIDALSIPRGFCSQKIMNQAAEAGYKTIFTSDDRIVVRSDWDLGRFISVIDNGPSLIDKAKEFIKNSVRRTVGDRNYDKIRSGLLR